MDRQSRIRCEAAAPALRNLEAVDLTSEVVSKYIEALRQEDYSNSTINHRAQQLRQAFKVGIRNKALSQQPFIGLDFSLAGAGARFNRCGGRMLVMA